MDTRARATPPHLPAHDRSGRGSGTDAEQAGAAGVGNVLALASGAKTSGETLVLPMTLVVRESTAPRRAVRG